MSHVPEIRVIRERCVACADCVSLCPQSGPDSPSPVLGIEDGTAAVLEPEGCIACYSCVEFCRAAAIFLALETPGHEGQPELYRTRPPSRIV